MVRIHPSQQNIYMDIIFKALVGSHSYGTNIEGSDRDYKGVYIQTPEDVLERGYQEEVRVGKDEVYYELRRFVELAAKGNPTVMELLYSPEDCILIELPIWKMLKENRDSFLSLSCKYSFGGYAYSQISKAGGLEKKMNWEKEKTVRKTVLDFCYVIPLEDSFKSLTLKEWLKREKLNQKFCGLSAINHFRFTYNLFYDHLAEMKNDNPRFEGGGYGYKGVVQDEETSNDISLSDIPTFAKRDSILYFNKDGYQEHCKDYLSYQKWLKERNTQRYVDVEEHGQRIDGKNLLHCVRLLETGIEIAKEKTIRVRRPNAAYLIEIRKGKHNLQKILDSCKDKMKEMDEAFDKSHLPPHADRGKLFKLVNKMRKEFYNQNKQLC